VSVGAAFAAWFGGSILLLGDGRRGLALGLAVLTAGLALFAIDARDVPSAVALGLGGAAAAALRLRSGPEGWGLMRPGSTPRILLAIVTGILALYVAASLATGDGAPVRFGWVVAMTLSAARVLQTPEPAASVTAACALALSIGAAAAIAPASSGVVAAIVAAVIAVGVAALPQATPRGA
jgi:hypothetical protein